MNNFPNEALKLAAWGIQTSIERIISKFGVLNEADIFVILCLGFLEI